MKNWYSIIDGRVYIRLDRTGDDPQYAIVSYDKLSKLSELNVKWNSEWDSQNGVYCAVARKYVNGKRVKLLLHRVVTECPSDFFVVHLDGNQLNCIDENLSVTQQNRSGAFKRRRHDGPAGIYMDMDRLMYYIAIPANKENVVHGYYLTLDEAVTAYKNAGGIVTEEMLDNVWRNSLEYYTT